MSFFKNRPLLPFLSGTLIVLTSFWGVMLARQRSSNKLSEEKLEQLAVKASAESGVDKHLIRAVIRAESAGRPNAVSPAGARGLMQLMPGTARDMLRKLKLPKNTDWLEPSVNVRLGTRYLRDMSRMFGGDLDKILASYNGGPGNVRKWIRRAKKKKKPSKWLAFGFRETRNYVVVVKKYYNQNKSQASKKKESDKEAGSKKKKK